MKRFLMDSPLFSSYLKKTKVEKDAKPKFQDIPLNEDIEEDKEIYRFTSNIETSYQVDKNKIIHQDTYRFSKVGFNLGKILDNTENFQANGFACGDVLPDDFGFPTLKVKIGEKLKQVSLPLTEKKQADELIKVFTKAPFGHGVETKLDEKIRKTWQLEPEDFQLGGKKWDSNLTNLIEQHIKPGLGIPKNQKVCSSIYKLLLYEKDGHFDYHRDTEKAERMFAKLTIMLPSVFTDGHLIVKQDDNEKVFKYEEESVAYYTAFYCDCEHKVTPVTSGYRMCAVYNLCFEDENSVVESRRFEKMYAELETLVNQWIAKPEKPLLPTCYNMPTLQRV